MRFHRISKDKTNRIESGSDSPNTGRILRVSISRMKLGPDEGNILFLFHFGNLFYQYSLGGNTRLFRGLTSKGRRFSSVPRTRKLSAFEFSLLGVLQSCLHPPAVKILWVPAIMRNARKESASPLRTVCPSSFLLPRIPPQRSSAFFPKFPFVKSYISFITHPFHAFPFPELVSKAL